MALHRVIILSSTYRQRSDDRPNLAQFDAENRLLGRMNRQRLEFEALRDSSLAVAGRLDATPGGPAVELFKAPFTRRRSIYGFVERQNLPGALRTFDFASPDTHCPQRLSHDRSATERCSDEQPVRAGAARELRTRPAGNVAERAAVSARFTRPDERGTCVGE